MQSWRRKMVRGVAASIAFAIVPAALARPSSAGAEADARAIQGYIEIAGRFTPPSTPPSAAAPAPTIAPPAPVQPLQPWTEEGRFGVEPSGGATTPGPISPEPPVVTVVPLPTPVGLGMAGLLILSTIRRRKTV